MGNIGSIVNMLKKIGTKCQVTSSPQDILQATKLILPGVGAFKKGMENLHELKLIDSLKQKVIEQFTPILGICLGMQLFTKHSEEGDVQGLSLIDAETKRFQFQDGSSSLKVPHMGWNIVDIKQKNHPLFYNMTDEEIRSYFVHSYYVHCHHKENVLAETFYGFPFTSAIYHKNIIGVQFHPEKSHKFGLKMFKNFVERC